MISQLSLDEKKYTRHNTLRLLMGNCCCSIPNTTKVQREKRKLRQVQDGIRAYIHNKNAEIADIESQAKAYAQKFQQKKVMNLLQTKKNLIKVIERAELRIKLIDASIAELERSNATKDTVDLLQASNQYTLSIYKKDSIKTLDYIQRNYSFDSKNRIETEANPQLVNKWSEGRNSLSKDQQKKSARFRASYQ